MSKNVGGDGDEEFAWWEKRMNLPSMSLFENSLQCPICKELLDNPKCIRTCLHFFCDLCISREFSFRNRCPVCKEEYSKSEIIKVPFVSDLMDLYSMARRDLVQKLSNSQLEKEDQFNNNHSIAPISESQESFDWSFQRSKHSSPSSTSSSFSNKIPSLCYSILKNNQLKEYLKKFNLPTNGTREQMIWRIKEYILRHNSNIDRAKPFSEEQIISSIVKEEREREQLKSKGTAHSFFSKTPKKKDTSVSPSSVDLSSEISEGNIQFNEPTVSHSNKSQRLSSYHSDKEDHNTNKDNSNSSFTAIVLSPEDSSIIILTPPFKNDDTTSSDDDDKERESSQASSPQIRKRKQTPNDTPTEWKKRCTVKIRRKNIQN
ncbi:hypothetical protein FDP41_005187 [Naegleria fowleri]|uniref:Postreplication repair E3 ubiquitin-protein ligase RAD18 n=1 Tax=Naegleria fowleri TaxID=5763 RepID=A0A6A5BPL1_NAEFO|nr:uncharacterized protein FDP41_005187 [Naegleria fowleri]KAF0975860.1 hypothetical protein FDP41_005187 [Naegleria fowleri]CAG4709060.1 unnamed protein product [Naegleria fowleri]